MTTLVVVAGVRFYREGLAELFAGAEGFSVAGTAAGATEAVPLIRETAADIALVATDLGAEPAALVHAIVACRPATRVVVIGIAVDHPDVMPLAEAGVAGYATSDASADEVVAVVRGVVRGEAPCPPRIASALLDRVATLARERRHEANRISPLTTRELEIVQLIERGLSNKQIASDLRIEVATVKNHVHNILEKLNVARRGQAAAAIRREI